MWLADLEALRPHLAAWNHEVQRSMDEYAAHPRAACTDTRWIEGSRRPCDELATHGTRCYWCAREAGKQAVRVKAYRARIRRAADQQRYRDRQKS